MEHTATKGGGMWRRIAGLLVDILVYGATGLLSQLLSFVLLPLYTHRLSPSDYGVLAMVAIVPMLFVTVATGGMKSSVFYRFNKCETEQIRGVMLTTSMVPVVVSTTLLLCAGLLFLAGLTQVLIGHVDDTALTAVRLSLFSAALATLAEIPKVAIQCYRRARTVSFINISQLLVTTCVTIWLVIEAQLGVLGVVWGTLVGQVYGTIAAVIALVPSLAWRFDRQMYKEMVVYGLPYLPHRLQALGMAFLGDYVVRAQLGLHDAGIYNVAAKFAVPISFFTGAFYQAWQPYKYKVFAEDADPKGFFRSTLSYFAVLMATAWVGLSLLGPELLRLLTAADFHDGAALVWAVVLMRILQGTHPMLATGIDVAKSARAIPLTTLAGLIVMIVATLLLVPPLGPLGAALAGALAWGTTTVASNLVSQRAYRIEFDWATIALVVGGAVACVAGAQLVRTQGTALRLAVVVPLCALFPLFGLAMLARAPDDRARLRKVVEVVRTKVFAKLGRRRASAEGAT